MAELNETVRDMLTTALNQKLQARVQFETNYNSRHKEYQIANELFQRATKMLNDIDREINALKDVLDIG